MTSPVTPEVCQRGDVTLIKFGPRYESLDEFTVNQLTDFLLETAKAATPPNVVIDLRYTEFFGSTFIELLLRVWKQLIGKGGNLALTGLKPNCREVVQATKLDKFWPLDWKPDDDSDGV